MCHPQYGTGLSATTKSRHFYSWIKKKTTSSSLVKKVSQLDQFPGLVCHELDTNACVGTLWEADTAD